MTRNTGSSMNSNRIKTLQPQQVDQLLADGDLALAVKANVAMVRCAHGQIEILERTVRDRIKPRPEFCFLKTVPGIGQTLALTILLETGDIGRFAGVGNYASYCRCVGSQKLSNGKKKVRAIPRTVISICPGRLSKRPTSRSDTMRGSKASIRERRPRATACWRSKRWPTSCGEPVTIL